MASLWKFTSVLLQPKNFYVANIPLRCLSTTNSNNSNGGEGWFSKLLHVRKIDPGKDSHSRLLADSTIVYEMQIHDVKPDCMDKYMKAYEDHILLMEKKFGKSVTELVGSFRVEIGDQDQVLHIWRIFGGYNTAHRILEQQLVDPDLMKMEQAQVACLRRRINQFMMAFSFWGDPKPREGKNMYEMRSYILKPGTMIEWGNNWARGITYRRDHAVAGFFSQIGQLYQVHHLWGYTDLTMRKEIREAAWRKPGWDECVAYTVPLIRKMRARWLRPTPFSPLH